MSDAAAVRDPTEPYPVRCGKGWHYAERTEEEYQARLNELHGAMALCTTATEKYWKALIMFEGWDFDDMFERSPKRAKPAPGSSTAAGGKACAAGCEPSAAGAKEVQVSHLKVDTELGKPQCGSAQVCEGAQSSTTRGGGAAPTDPEAKKKLIEHNKQVALERRRQKEQAAKREGAVFEAMQWHA